MECSGDAVRAYFGHMGRWDREAWRATVLAAELDVVLNVDALVLCDVREVMALECGLEQALESLPQRHRATLSIPGVPEGVVDSSRAAHGVDLLSPARVAQLIKAAGRWTWPIH